MLMRTLMRRKRTTASYINKILKTSSLRDFIYAQYLRYVGHMGRSPNTAITKEFMFAKPKNPIIVILGSRLQNCLELTNNRQRGSPRIEGNLTG